MVKRSNKSLKEQRLAAALYYARQNRLERLAGGSTPVDPDPQTVGNTDGALSTSNYSMKGDMYTLGSARKIISVTGKFTQAVNITLLIAEVDASGIIQSILYDGGSFDATGGGSPGVRETVTPATPVELESGKRYAVAFYRTAGGGMNFYTDSNNPPIDSGGDFTPDGNVRVNNNTPAVSDNINYSPFSSYWGVEIDHEAV